MNELSPDPQGDLAFADEALAAQSTRSRARPADGPAKRRRSGFGGYSWAQIAGTLALIAAAAWGGWVTREMLALKDRRIVAVNLSALVNDFIMAEARSGNPPQVVERETRHFMGTLNAALQARARAGETIIVGEAVVASSVPDITADIRAEVGEGITANGQARRPANAAAAAGAAPPQPGEAASGLVP